MTARHLITGSTGFIGGALVLELLRQTRDAIVVIVRPGDTSAADRFHGSIGHAIAIYQSDIDMAEVWDRCRVVAGDVTAPDCGLREELGRVTQVWHSAASLRYENRHCDEIRATNVEGTRHALALAERAGAEAFNYVSTAYVAGRATGVIHERPVADVCTNNHYERSKVDAERLVAGASSLRARVLRPSIVVGHSRTLAATSFSGFYGFVRNLVQFRGMVERAQAGLLARTPLSIRLDAGAPINLVPVDQVARQAVRIGLSDAAGVFHLTHASPPTVGDVVRTIFEVLGLHPPEFVDSAEALDWLGARFDQRLDFYGSYLIGDKRFDRGRSDAVLGSEREAEVVHDRAAIAALARWYLTHLDAQRANLPVAR